MIKGHMKTGDGRDIILLGLSEKNVERLKKGDPVVIFKHDMPPHLHHDIVIVYGETEQAIVEKLREEGFITEETVQMPTPGQQ